MLRRWVCPSCERNSVVLEDGADGSSKERVLQGQRVARVGRNELVDDVVLGQHRQGDGAHRVQGQVGARVGDPNVAVWGAKQQAGVSN